MNNKIPILSKVLFNNIVIITQVITNQTHISDQITAVDNLDLEKQ